MGRPRPGDFTRRRADVQRPQTDLLRVEPGFVNRRTDDERPEPFLVLVPPDGLSLRAAWSICRAWALESGDDRRGAVFVAFYALADAHEEAGLPVVDDDGTRSRWTLHALDALGRLVDFDRGDGLVDATVVRNDDGVLVLTPPTVAALQAAAAADEPEHLDDDVAPAPAPAPAPRPGPVREPAPRPVAADSDLDELDPEPTSTPDSFTRPTSTAPATPSRIEFPGTVRRRPGGPGRFRAVTF